jgi:hypothetical protein
MINYTKAKKDKEAEKLKADLIAESKLNSQTRRQRPNRKLVPSEIKISKTPSLNTLINDALSIIGSELAYYSNKTKRGASLDLKEARIVTAYMDSLVKMSKEVREAQKPEQLEHLSDEQLIELAGKAITQKDIQELE